MHACLALKIGIRRLNATRFGQVDMFDEQWRAFFMDSIKSILAHCRSIVVSVPNSKSEGEEEDGDAELRKLSREVKVLMENDEVENAASHLLFVAV